MSAFLGVVDVCDANDGSGGFGSADGFWTGLLRFRAGLFVRSSIDEIEVAIEGIN